MVIFHSYVSLPEGTFIAIPSSPYDSNTPHMAPNMNRSNTKSWFYFGAFYITGDGMTMTFCRPTSIKKYSQSLGMITAEELGNLMGLGMIAPVAYDIGIGNTPCKTWAFKSSPFPLAVNVQHVFKKVRSTYDPLECFIITQLTRNAGLVLSLRRLRET